MGRMRKKNVGDRIYFECIDGSIGTRIVTGIKECQGKKEYGQPDMYYEYYTGPNEMIESYLCLADSNPRIRKYISENKRLLDFEAEFIRWMRENGYSLDNTLVKEVLYKYGAA